MSVILEICTFSKVIPLINDIRKKDKNSITILYNQYGRKLYGYAVYRWNLNEDEAWELVYKTLYKTIDVIDKYNFENENKFKGFIYQSFINNLRNYYNEQKVKKIQTVPLEENNKHESKEKETESPDSIYMRCLKQILAQFDDWKRILLLMKAQNYRYEEIATYVNKPADQLKVYYMRAKQSLTEKVNECVNKG